MLKVKFKLLDNKALKSTELLGCKIWKYSLFSCKNYCNITQYLTVLTV